MRQARTITQLLNSREYVLGRVHRTYSGACGACSKSWPARTAGPQAGGEGGGPGWRAPHRAKGAPHAQDSHPHRAPRPASALPPLPVTLEVPRTSGAVGLVTTAQMVAGGPVTLVPGDHPLLDVLALLASIAGTMLLEALLLGMLG